VHESLGWCLSYDAVEVAVPAVARFLVAATPLRANAVQAGV